MFIIQYLFFAILVLISILFFVKIGNSNFDVYETYTSSTADIISKSFVIDAITNMENKIVNSLKYIDGGVNHVKNTIVTMNSSNLQTYEQDIKKLFDDKLLSKNEEKIIRNVIQEFSVNNLPEINTENDDNDDDDDDDDDTDNDYTISDKKIRILEFIFFANSNNTSSIRPISSHESKNNMFKSVVNYSDYLKIMSTELGSYVDSPFNLNLNNNQQEINKFRCRIVGCNQPQCDDSYCINDVDGKINVLKIIRFFRNKYVRRDGTIKSDLFENWVRYYPDQDYYASEKNEHLFETYLKHQIITLMQVLSIDDDDDD